jgi:hypothetical protein
MRKQAGARRGGVVAIMASVAIGATALTACNGDAGTELWLRELEPVVLTGADLPAFAGTSAGGIVAFRWNTQTSGWEQVPVQVDQRHLEYMTKLRNGTGTTGPQTLAYSDPAANAGPDPVSTFDANDEVVFMTDDTGGVAPASASDPAGVVPGSGLQVTVTDPLAPEDGNRGRGLGYAYLFRRSGSGLVQSAGLDYVDYHFDPIDPDGHAEDSTITTDRYSTHFSARWTRDGLRPFGGPDILDRHRNLFAAGVCGRSEDTFSAGEGGFATNIDGAVRAIRSYLGANSGTYTQREHLFYRGTERVQTFLRVHDIPGIMDFYDYSPAAAGMRYSSSSTPGGVTVDGVPDVVGAAAPTWEAVTGSQGALISTTSQETDIAGMAVQSYYTDDTTPPFTQCTGDAFEYGASGTAITSAIPNTDPTLPGTVHHLTATRWNVYVPTRGDPTVARHVANLTTPVTVATTPFVPGP